MQVVAGNNLHSFAQYTEQQLIQSAARHLRKLKVEIVVNFQPRGCSAAEKVENCYKTSFQPLSFQAWKFVLFLNSFLLPPWAEQCYHWAAASIAAAAADGGWEAGFCFSAFKSHLVLSCLIGAHAVLSIQSNVITAATAARAAGRGWALLSEQLRRGRNFSHFSRFMSLCLIAAHT